MLNSGFALRTLKVNSEAALSSRWSWIQSSLPPLQRNHKNSCKICVMSPIKKVTYLPIFNWEILISEGDTPEAAFLKLNLLRISHNLMGGKCWPKTQQGSSCSYACVEATLLSPRTGHVLFLSWMRLLKSRTSYSSLLFSHLDTE